MEILIGVGILIGLVYFIVKAIIDIAPIIGVVALIVGGIILLYFSIRLLSKLLHRITPTMRRIPLDVRRIALTIYFKSKKFTTIKERIKSYIADCNELNTHIEELKSISVIQKHVDYGVANLIDNSIYNFQRPESDNTQYKSNIYNCSLSVCKNAQLQPFKYLCKYFDVKPTEENLSCFEALLNNFAAAEQGKELLQKEHDRIISSISNDVPRWVRKHFPHQLSEHLGFKMIDLSSMYFPKYIFQYVSPGGNSSMNCEIVMDIENLNKFVVYLSEIIKFKKSAAGQRALMTSALREKIKERDNYTCQICGLSIYQEPNLLLEIDHIHPVSKGGLTVEGNLQTLCWRCNREKGNKLL